MHLLIDDCIFSVAAASSNASLAALFPIARLADVVSGASRSMTPSEKGLTSSMSFMMDLDLGRRTSANKQTGQPNLGSRRILLSRANRRDSNMWN
jgi:hypothetical protein